MSEGIESSSPVRVKGEERIETSARGLENHMYRVRNFYMLAIFSGLSMVLQFVASAKFILEECAELQPTDSLLVLSDTYSTSLGFAQALAEVARSTGAETTMVIMPALQVAGQEPPKPVASAMKSVDKICVVVKFVGLGHTKARKEATDLGVKYFITYTELGEDYFTNFKATSKDMELIKKRTEGFARRLSGVENALVTSKLGTNLRVRLKDRSGIAIHPTARTEISMVPDYAEAAIAPVEESSEGTIVFDIAIIGWGRLLKAPLELTVHKGRIVEVKGDERDREQFTKIINRDENANLLAELALGTSHTIPPMFQGTRWDAGIMGVVHIGLGRNDNIGGKSYSRTHMDGIISRASVRLDGVEVLREGVLVEPAVT